MKSGSLNLLEPSGPRRACYGTPLPYYLQFYGRRHPLIRTFTYTVYTHPYKMPWVLCLYFQVQYTFGPLYSFLVRSPSDRDNIHTWLFSKFILFDWRMRSLIASSRAACPTLVITGKTMLTGLRTQFKWSGEVPCTRQEGRGTALLILTWTSCTREKSLAPDRIRTPDRQVVENATTTPWEVTNRNERNKTGTARTLPKFLCFSMYCLFCIGLCTVCV